MFFFVLYRHATEFVVRCITYYSRSVPLQVGLEPSEIRTSIIAG